VEQRTFATGFLDREVIEVPPEVVHEMANVLQGGGTCLVGWDGVGVKSVDSLKARLDGVEQRAFRLGVKVGVVQDVGSHFALHFPFVGALLQ
jgi:selenophosphate synthetase-related protein